MSKVVFRICTTLECELKNTGNLVLTKLKIVTESKSKFKLKKDINIIKRNILFIKL